MGTSTERVMTSGRWSEAELAHAPPGKRGEPNRQRAAALADAVELEVVPRLLLATRRRAVVVPAVVKPDSGDVVRMTGLVLASDLPGQDDLVHCLRAQGASVEAIYLNLLAPAARRLGELW